MIATSPIRYAAFFFLILAIGCASQKGVLPPPPVPATTPESKDAQAIYNYLAYREYLRDQDPAQAIQSLEVAIELAPTPELYLELGNLYWRATRFDDAHQILKDGLRIFPDAQVLLLTLAKTYAAQGRFDDAVLTLDDYLEKHPDLVELVHEAAAYRIEQRNYADAVDRLMAIPKGKVTTVTGFLLGKAFFGLGLYDRAIEHFEKVVETDPEYFDAWVEMALTYEAIKNYVDAERIFAELHETGADNPQIIFRLVDLNLKLNNPDKALAYVLQAQDDQTLALEAANLFLNQDFYDHAAQLLDPLAAQTPIPVNALFYLAVLEYEGREDAAKARAYLEAIPEGHAHHERAMIFRVHLLFQDGEKDAAKELCLLGMKLYPAQVDFPVLLAEIHEHAKHYDQSLDVLLKAASAWPGNSAITYRLGLVHDKMGDHDQAMVMMEKTISLNPEHADALNYLGYTLADQGRDLERAVVLIENAIRVEPDNGYFIDSLAWVYFKQKKIRQAWQEIKRAVRFAPEDPVIWEHYGDIAAAMHFPGEARKGYTKSVRLNGENVNAVRAKLEALRGLQ
ncbi:MAG: tetratricopeptide repeat protein [Deltaproteobacteria bacterium]|nr:tetratricopeptide repeat protein [Deltaproteobacteria bacterium]